jgi:hypothetical protein
MIFLRSLLWPFLTFFLITSYSCYSESSSSSNIDLLVSGGYTAFNIQGNQYTGYDASLKMLFPLRDSKYFSLGFGTKYDNVSYTPPSLPGSQTNYLHSYQSLQAGADFSFKYSFSYVTFLLNPYLYYSLYDSWLQTTTAASYQQTYSPDVAHNFNYGIGLFILFKYLLEDTNALISGYYFGPSAYFSQGYLIYDPTNDSKGNSNFGGEGSYNFYSMNFTIGMFF